MEWWNDRGKNRTRNRGNIITECKINNHGMQMFDKEWAERLRQHI